ncbi:MAG: NAD(P)/FAD-dependent oxidoreductase [Lachnospiraceae bacterium]
MAAIHAARGGAKVTLLERNEKPGKKLLATGNGRCNLTNLLQKESVITEISGSSPGGYRRFSGGPDDRILFLSGHLYKE